MAAEGGIRKQIGSRKSLPLPQLEHPLLLPFGRIAQGTTDKADRWFAKSQPWHEEAKFEMDALGAKRQ